MIDTINASTYPRRTVLRAAGLLAGATAALAAFPLGVAAAGPAARDTLRLAALLPQSSAHPQFGAHFLAGLRLAFQQANWPIALQTEEIGRGAGLNPASVGALLASSGAALLVGMVNSEVAADLRDLLAERDVVFINATVGANIPRQVDSSPHILHYTLSHWQANWALGRWAATSLGKRGLISTSLYDSGFDAHYAFRLGFEAAGGTVVLTHTSHIPPGTSDPAQLVAPLASQRADFVYAGYCGQSAAEFIRAHNQAGLTKRLPLIGPSFLADESLLPGLGSMAVGIRTAAAWSADVNNAENRRFLAAYRAQSGQTPSAFALLGYETGQLIATAAATAPPAAGNTAALRDALAVARFAGARGAVAMNAQTRELTGPVYLRTVKSASGALVNATTTALTPPADGDRSIAALRDSLKTGWLSPYLCV